MVEITASITSYNEHYVKLRYPTCLCDGRHVFGFCGKFCSSHSLWLEALKFWISHRTSHRVKNTAIIKDPIIAK